MFSHILLPIADDQGETTDRALALAARLRAEGGKLTLLHVVEAIPSYVLSQIPGKVLEEGRKSVQETLDRIAARSEGGAETAIIKGHGGDSITRYAEEHGVDAIVITSHRPEFQDVFFGSTAAHVVRHAPCSVMVLR